MKAPIFLFVVQLVYQHVYPNCYSHGLFIVDASKNLVCGENSNFSDTYEENTKTRLFLTEVLAKIMI